MKHLLFVLLLAAPLGAADSPLPESTAKQTPPAKYILFCVHESGANGVLSTDSGVPVTTPVIYRMNTETGQVWRLVSINVESKSGVLVNVEGWKPIPEKDPYQAGAEIAKTQPPKTP